MKTGGDKIKNTNQDRGTGGQGLFIKMHTISSFGSGAKKRRKKSSNLSIMPAVFKEEQEQSLSKSGWNISENEEESQRNLNEKMKKREGLVEKSKIVIWEEASTHQGSNLNSVIEKVEPTFTYHWEEKANQFNSTEMMPFRIYQNREEAHIILKHVIKFIGKSSGIKKRNFLLFILSFFIGSILGFFIGAILIINQHSKTGGIVIVFTIFSIFYYFVGRPLLLPSRLHRIEKFMKRHQSQIETSLEPLGKFIVLYSFEKAENFDFKPRQLPCLREKKFVLKGKIQFILKKIRNKNKGAAHKLAKGILKIKSKKTLKRVNSIGLLSPLRKAKMRKGKKVKLGFNSPSQKKFAKKKIKNGSAHQLLNTIALGRQVDCKQIAVKQFHSTEDNKQKKSHVTYSSVDFDKKHSELELNLKPGEGVLRKSRTKLSGTSPRNSRISKKLSIQLQPVIPARE